MKIFKNRFYTPILTIPLLLSLLGLFFIFEASSIYSFTLYGDSFYFLKLQLIWLGLSLGVMLFFALFDYHRLYYLAFLIMLSSIIFLILVLIPGFSHQIKGARRWLDLGFLNVQPTELAKFSVIIYLAAWFTHKERKRFFSFLILLGILMFLIILQPDMGTALTIFLLAIFIYFISDNPILPLLLFLPIFPFVFYALIKIAPYRLARLKAFLDPSIDPLGISYHINQIFISLINGGLFGTGFGASRQKYMYLPEAHTDSIFAIIAEDFGFIGSVIIIFIYLVFIYRIYHLFLHAPDKFSKLLIGGIFLLFNLQTIINLAAIVNLIPLTGISLPFLSYGGSNLLISFALIGVLINIEKKIKKI